VEPVCNDLVNL